MLVKVISLLILILSSPGLIASAQRPANDLQKNASNVTQNIIYENWFDKKRNRDIPVKIYLPEKELPSTPVVIFSHGLGGSREAANGPNLIDRALDIKFVIDELEKRNQSDPRMKNKLNLKAIAMTGHSFGAGTSLAIAGQRFATRSTLADNRVKTAIYLCPPVRAAKANAAEAYGDIKIPGLLLTGTEDRSPIGDTSPAERRIPFDNIRAPHQYLVNFIGADHATFGGGSFRMSKESDKQYHDMIQEVTIKFLDATLKNDSNAWQWLNSQQAISYFGNKAMFERK